LAAAADEQGPLYTRALVAAIAITIAIHVATYLLQAVLPFHASALGATGTQVGFLFSMNAGVAMFLRPAVGGWVDRYGVRVVLLPGVAVLALTSLAFHAAATPAVLIALMAGIGLSNGLVSTAAGVLASQATAPARRGEALGVYYVATSLATAVAAPGGITLYRWGGIRPAYVLVTALAIALAALTLAMTPRGPLGSPAASARFRFWSRQALGPAGVMVLLTVGWSSIVGFVPLHAVRHGLDGVLPWFFGIYSGWLLLCRILLRRLSDQVGRQRVLVPAMAATALGFLLLAVLMPPTATSLLVVAFLLGTGASLTYPTMVALLVDRTPDRERGLAMGTLSASWDVGVVVGSALVGAVIERASFGTGFGVGAAGAFAAVALFLALERRYARAPAYSRRAAGV
jgi:MFS family permease